MTIGVGTFIPSAKFTSPRSYIYDFVIARYGDTITHSTIIFTIHAMPPDPTYAEIRLRQDWYDWSSKSYPLSYIVTDFFYRAGGVGPNIPLNFTLQPGISPLTMRPALFFTWFTGPPDWEDFRLPAQGADYWLPPPLP